MSKRNIFIIIIVILIIIGAGVFLYFQGMRISVSFENKNNQDEINKQIAIEEQKRALEEMRNAYNQQFPDVLDGTISIISDKKTTLTTADGKEYLISPARSMAFYRDSGIKNNEQVQTRGKILENNQLSLGSVIPLK